MASLFSKLKREAKEKKEAEENREYVIVNNPNKLTKEQENELDAIENELKKPQAVSNIVNTRKKSIITSMRNQQRIEEKQKRNKERNEQKQKRNEKRNEEKKKRETGIVEARVERNQQKQERENKTVKARANRSTNRKILAKRIENNALRRIFNKEEKRNKTINAAEKSIKAAEKSIRSIRNMFTKF